MKQCYQCKKMYDNETLIYDDEMEDYICRKCDQRFKDECDTKKIMCHSCNEYCNIDDIKYGEDYPYPYNKYGKICTDCMDDIQESEDQRETEEWDRPGRGAKWL